MKPKPIRDIKHPLVIGIDPNRRVDANDLDAAVFASIASCIEALKNQIPHGFDDLERWHLIGFIEGLPSSHKSIRILVSQGNNGSMVDALVIARLQLESLYNWCFLLEKPSNIHWYLKEGWKKTYIRFLLEREESVYLGSDQQFYRESGPYSLERLRQHSFVSEAEQRWLEYDQLGGTGTPPPIAEIPMFPSPHKIIGRLRSVHQRKMLERLYPEYQYLCSFAHGAAQASSFRSMLNTRSIFRHATEEWKRIDIERRRVAEASIFYSTISAIQIATELIILYPSNQELCAHVIRAWTLLLSSSLLARPLWDLRSRALLGVIELDKGLHA